MEDGLRPLGLSRTIWAILAATGHDGQRHPSDIADHVGIDRAAASRALRRLEADGLIARDDGCADGRNRTVALTEAGRGVLDHATRIARENAAAVAAPLTDTEQADLRGLLQKLIAGAEDRPTHL